MLQALTVLALIAAPTIGIAVLVYVPTRSLLDFSRAKSGRGYIALKAVAALAAWFFASWGMFFMFFVTAYTAVGGGDYVEEERWDAVSLLVLDLIYALVGGGLALWLRHKSGERP